ncbi:MULTISPECIES: acyl carrier protein [unclassified Streptomyces]|uniref:acyl carrier protein n=1 Tax=unclassified Streptomyces TaxID=2593676 RepID=UPI003FD2C532
MASRGIEEIRDWVLARNKHRDSLGPDEDLIGSRLVDSISFVELVYAIEAAADVEIDFDTIDIRDFQTISAMEKAFFA